MSSVRKANRRFQMWNRYFRKYPWHDATPGMLRAYNRVTLAGNARVRRN